MCCDIPILTKKCAPCMYPPVFRKNTRARTENMFVFLHVTSEWKEVQC